MLQKILVCLDGSSLAEQILPYVTEVALSCGSRVVLLEVTLPPSTTVEPLTGFYRTTPIEKVLREETDAQAYLKRVAQRLRKKGLKVSSVTVPGDPGETIVGYAKDNAVGLIALSTHGRSGLGRLAFGSVADFVLKRSGLPILIRKPEESKR
jgi:nucleotide-binding universal stress UspA family protein